MVDLGAGTLSFLQGGRAGWGGKGRHKEEQDIEGEQDEEKVRRRSTQKLKRLNKKNFHKTLEGGSPFYEMLS